MDPITLRIYIVFFDQVSAYGLDIAGLGIVEFGT